MLTFVGADRPTFRTFPRSIKCCPFITPVSSRRRTQLESAEVLVLHCHVVFPGLIVSHFFGGWGPTSKHHPMLSLPTNDEGGTQSSYQVSGYFIKLQINHAPHRFRCHGQWDAHLRLLKRRDRGVRIASNRKVNDNSSRKLESLSPNNRLSILIFPPMQKF